MDDKQKSMDLNNLGNKHSKLSEYNVALKYYQKSLELGESVYGKNNLILAPVICNIGNMYRKKGEYKKARKHLFISLLIKNYNWKCLYNLYKTYKETNEWVKALEMYERYYEIRIKHFNFYSFKVAVMTNVLGNIYCHLGEFIEAMGYYIHTMEIIERVYGKNSKKLIGLLNQMGEISYILGDNNEAEIYSSRKKEIKKM